MSTNHKYTDQEVREFIKQTNENLIIQDPEAVLISLNIDYKPVGSDSYKMNIRGEKNASAYITLKHGSWKYKDFGGTGSSGSIINVVMDTTAKGYRDALNYALQELNIPNFLTLALNSASESKTFSLTEEEKQKIEDRKKENKTREKSMPISKVKTVYEVSSNKNAVDFLRSRGINKTPTNLKLISGEYTSSKDNKQKRAFGVGVLTEDGSGADIHFLKKLGDLKTMSFGEKKVSFFPKEGSKKIAVFESKMDYAAVFQQIPLDYVNVVIANATSMYKRVAEIVKEGNYDSVMFFNQNDLPGGKFVLDVIENSGITEYKIIDYNLEKEYKKDNNDLLIDGVKFADRIIEGNEDLVLSIIEELKRIKEEEKVLNLNIEVKEIKNDLDEAELVF